MGRGLAHPDNLMTQDDAYELACLTGQLSERQRRVLRVLYRRSGVQQRYTALPHRIALDWLGKEEAAAASEALDAPVESSAEVRGPTTQERMEFYQQQAGAIAINAARDALLDAKLQHGEVTHLVTVSCTGFFAPGVDLQLIQQLDLPRTVQRVNVGFMGCHGMLNGLRTAKALASEPNSKVLLVAVELCSLHYYFPWDPDRMVGNALFSDGAAALVVQAGSDENAWSVVETASSVLEGTLSEMTWTISNHGFEMSLASQVPDSIREQLSPFLTDWLGKHQLTIDQIDHWVVHPGGPRILGAVEDVLNLGSGGLTASRSVLRDFGNMSSPTVMFILDQLTLQNAQGNAVMLGFGPGLVAEAALLRRAKS